MRHEKLGETLRREGFLSQEELDKGLERQTELRRKRIGDILLEEGKVKVAEIKEALNLQKTNFDSKLGEILIAAGTVTQEQVKKALAIQEKNSSKRLGQILVELGMVKEEMVALAVALKFGLPYVDLEEYPVDPEALKCVSVSLARKLSVLPLHLNVKELTIAFSDPTNLEPKRDLSFHTGKSIKEVVAAESGISTAIDRYYGPDSDSYLAKLLNEESEIEQLSGDSGDQFELGEDTGLEKPIIELVNHILKAAVVKKASDLHIIPEGRRVRIVLRIDGELHDELTLSGDRLPSVIARLKIMGNMNIAERRMPQDGRAKVKVGSRIVDLRFPACPASLERVWP